VEPDSQFFVECWTIGVPEATKNIQMRHSVLSGHEEESFEFHDSGLRRNSCPEENASQAEFFSSVFPSLLSGQFNFDCSPEVAESGVRIPNGDAFAEQFPGSQNTACPMTLQSARELLGVSLTSTPNQIKAAYRQKVRQWHPDRINDRYETARQFATEKLIAINEAYRLLRIPVI
jgi:DnaJ-domain-containing protein 1